MQAFVKTVLLVVGLGLLHSLYFLPVALGLVPLTFCIGCDKKSDSQSATTISSSAASEKSEENISEVFRKYFSSRDNRYAEPRHERVPEKF